MPDDPDPNAIITVEMAEHAAMALPAVRAALQALADQGYSIASLCASAVMVAGEVAEQHEMLAAHAEAATIGWLRIGRRTAAMCQAMKVKQRTGGTLNG